MENEPDKEVIKSRQGHRARLRAKFSKSGLVGLNDYEIVELLLTLGQPRKDCKLAAKEAIKRFKDLRGVLEAPPEELETIDGIGRPIASACASCASCPANISSKRPKINARLTQRKPF